MKPHLLQPHPEHLPFLNSLRAKTGRPLIVLPPAPVQPAKPPMQLNLADYIRNKRHAKTQG